MTVRLKPEIQSLVEQDVARGTYASVDEFVEQAVLRLHEQEEWLAKNQHTIAEQIEHAYQQAERGECVDPDTALSILKQRRASR